MSYEQSLISQAWPKVLANRAAAILNYEVQKGCSPLIRAHPVALEPRYDPIQPRNSEFQTGNLDSGITELPLPSDRLVRLRIWLAPKEAPDSRRTERFLKQLQGVTHRIAFEIEGNQEHVLFSYLLHRDDVPLVQAAYQGEFPSLELAPAQSSVRCPPAAERLKLRDFFPTPPYTHLLTRLSELKFSPFDAFFAALSSVEAPASVVLQVLFQPVAKDHNWHRNVAMLQDLEYAVKLQTSPHAPFRYGQQVPSGELGQMTTDLETKAHDDKPFFAAALRLFALYPKSEVSMEALSAFVGLFQHGGRPLSYVSDEDFRSVLRDPELQTLLTHGVTYRPGFLVNSWELSGLCHFPPPETIERYADRFATLPLIPGQHRLNNSGTVIGVSVRGGRDVPIHVSEEVEACNTHIIGNIGTGKSTLLEDLAVQDMERGRGVVVLDPHGDLVDRLLGLVPEPHIDRAIYFDPGNPDWVPLWNPLVRVPGQDTGRTADELVGAFKSFMDGWGDRLGHLLRNTFCALLELPGATLFDATELLQKKSRLGERLRHQIVSVVKNEHTRRFWQYGFARYGNADLAPPQHKLGQLFSSISVSRMLSQPEGRIDVHRILETQQILLIDLSKLGSEIRNVLGAFLLALVHMAALGRSIQPPQNRKPVTVYCDEAHRFTTDALEDLLNEGRKFNVRFCLAHHQMGQLSKSKADALAGVGMTFAFRVGAADAAALARGFMGKVETSDIISLPNHEAIARVGTDVVSLRTRPPRAPLRPEVRERILSQSRDRYYVSTQDWRTKASFPTFHLQGAEPVRPEDPHAFEYDEF